jgi:hypothetical protein
MDEGGKAFSGTYNKGDNPDDVENTWNGKLPAVAETKAPEKVTPPPISFTGVWKALRGTTSMTLKLLQSGDQVTGQFESNAGSAVTSLSEGIVVGNTLRFKFKLAPADRTARGSGELVLAEDGKSFKGYIAGAATSGTFVQPSASDGTVSGNETRPPALFAGVWKAVAGEVPITLKLQQTGNAVVGESQADGGGPVISIFDGIVVANTLRFKLAFADDGGELGDGELVIDESRTSIKGKIGGVATIGNLVGPQNR